MWATILINLWLHLFPKGEKSKITQDKKVAFSSSVCIADTHAENDTLYGSTTLTGALQRTNVQAVLPRLKPPETVSVLHGNVPVTDKCVIKYTYLALSVVPGTDLWKTTSTPELQQGLLYANQLVTRKTQRVRGLELVAPLPDHGGERRDQRLSSITEGQWYRQPFLPNEPSWRTPKWWDSGSFQVGKHIHVLGGE